jgi:hypothetical protein
MQHVFHAYIYIYIYILFDTIFVASVVYMILRCSHVNFIVFCDMCVKIYNAICKYINLYYNILFVAKLYKYYCTRFDAPIDIII